MKPSEVREEWVRLAGDAFDNAPREQGDHALRGPMAHALAAVLPLAVAEEREACAEVLAERIREIQHNIDDNIAEVRVAEVKPADNRPLIKARDWLRAVLDAIRSRGEPR